MEAKQRQKALQKAIKALSAAASAYEPILSTEHNAIMLMPLPANIHELIALPTVLKNEASRLEEQLDKIEPRRRMKRFGGVLVQIGFLSGFYRGSPDLNPHKHWSDHTSRTAKNHLKNLSAPEPYPLCGAGAIFIAISSRRPGPLWSAKVAHSFAAAGIRNFFWKNG